MNNTIALLDSVIGYDRVASDYDKGRPDYPREVISLMTSVLNLRPEMRVLDLAAGTGKVTKALEPLKLHIIAVEPVKEMREIYSGFFPDIPIVEGTAEKIPLEDQSIDVVFVGTAFHWFDGEKALNEIARVLKPQGKLALLWNSRAIEVPWVKEVWNVLENVERGTSHDSVPWQSPFHTNPSFSSLSHYTYHYSFEGGEKEVLDRLFSAKLMGKLSSSQREEVIAKVLGVLRTHPDLKGMGSFQIPYRAEFYWCQKL